MEGCARKINYRMKIDTSFYWKEYTLSIYLKQLNIM